jgi:hypothetical protein
MGKASVAKSIASKMVSASKNLGGTEDALRILERYSNVEDATKLVGPERKAYLDALDVVYGDRSRRAKDLGYTDPTTYYHGTKHDEPIEQFRASGTQEGDVAKAGKGVYLSSNPEIAGGYVGKGDGGSIYPVKLKYRSGGEFEPDDLSLAKDIIEEQGLGPKGPKEKLRSTERGLHALQRTGEDPQDVLRKSNLRYSEDTGNIVVADPSEIRSTNAAFDPRFKESANILALNGNQAPKIAARMLAPKMSLGQAFSDITEPIDKLDAPVNNLIDKAATKFAQQTDLSRGTDKDHAGRASTAFNIAAGMIAPTPSNLMLGGAAKALPILNAIKPSAIANSVKVEKSAAELYREAKAANKVGGFGTVTVKDTKPMTSFGTVTVKP